MPSRWYFCKEDDDGDDGDKRDDVDDVDDGDDVDEEDDVQQGNGDDDLILFCKLSHR